MYRIAAVIAGSCVPSLLLLSTAVMSEGQYAAVSNCLTQGDVGCVLGDTIKPNGFLDIYHSRVNATRSLYATRPAC
jgi:hypothetical protein